MDIHHRAVGHGRSFLREQFILVRRTVVLMKAASGRIGPSVYFLRVSLTRSTMASRTGADKESQAAIT